MGFPVGYAPPVVVTAAVATTSFPETMSPAQMCGHSVTFDNDTVVARQLTPLVVQTVGTRVLLTGSNFGFSPVVTAGLLVAPSFICSHSHEHIDVIINPGEGSGLQFAAVGWTIDVSVAGQDNANAPLRMRYDDPVVDSVAGDGPTQGGAVLTITGEWQENPTRVPLRLVRTCLD